MTTHTLEKIAYGTYWILGWFFDFTKLIIVLGFVFFLILYFGAMPSIVNGSSMQPTYRDREVVFVDRATYLYRHPIRGEVVSFQFPGAEQQKFIKRIIGIPGDTVTISSGKVYVNNTLISEPYLLDNTYTQPNVTLDLQDNEYFVLGDARDNSLDSRSWGSLPSHYIIGRVRAKMPNVFATLPQAHQVLLDLWRAALSVR